MYSDRYYSRKIRRDTSDKGDIDTISNSTYDLHSSSTSRNRGPLLTTALALFGEGSFLASRMARPEAYTSPNRSLENEPQIYACFEKVPFMSLLSDRNGVSSSTDALDPCIFVDSWRNTDHQINQIDLQMATSVHSLYYNAHDDDYSSDRITNAFSAAAFLANEALLLSEPYFHSWDVKYDSGADTLVRVIPTAGIVLTSILLGLYLFALVALALYSAWGPHWTAQLDSFAMMQIGATVADKIQFRVADEDARYVKCLDRIPGAIGDATRDETDVGQLGLGLGAGAVLRARGKYAGHVNQEPGEKT